MAGLVSRGAPAARNQHSYMQLVPQRVKYVKTYSKTTFVIDSCNTLVFVFFPIQFYEGYGQTECTAGCSLTIPGDWTAGEYTFCLRNGHLL